MKHCVLKSFFAMLLVATLSLWGYAQTSTSSLSGVVLDQSGGVIPGVDVTVKNNDTGAEFKTVTAENGTFLVPALSPGTYTATISAPNFKQAIYKDIKLVAGTPGTIRVTLQVGGTTEVVTVQAGAEIVQSQTANITTTLVSSQLTNLPLATRNVMDFITMLPGVSTTGSARNSTINGLPTVTINITVDGVNTQDNYNKNGDGFFSYISPRLDAMEEVTISTATPGAEAAGSGSVQIRFVTRSGNNDYHGSIYYYTRNPALNGNYWFNNRDKVPAYQGDGPSHHQPCTATQLVNEWDKCKAMPDRYLLNQGGARVGGPISIPHLFSGKDKAFFFVNYEEFHLPSQITRTKTLYVPAGEQGNFQYLVGGVTQSVNLMTLAAANGQVATIDPTIAKVLSTVRASVNQGTLQATSDPMSQYFIFTNSALGVRKYPTVRFDFNLTSKQRLEISWNFSNYNSVPDILNNVDPPYPGSKNFGTQIGPRFQFSTALRSTLSPRIVNEARVGLTGGITVWYANVAASMFDWMDGFGWSLSGVSAPYIVRSGQRRSTPTENIDETLTWTKGSHGISFGGSWSNIGSFYYNANVVPTVSFGLDTSNDPARFMFDATNGAKNFPGAAPGSITTAGNIYASLTGRVTTVSASAYLNEKTLKYTYNGPTIQRAHQRELAFFATDSWRFRPNLTVNYGVRWEVQLPWTPLNDVYTFASAAQVWGLSGTNSLFKPGATGGVATTFAKYNQGDPAYDTYWKALAPSLGFAWTPGFKDGFLSKMFGSGAQSVFRGGFSVSYNRYSMADYVSIFGSNPGSSITATRSQGLGNLITNTGTDVWPLLFSQKSRLGAPTFADSPVYPLIPTVANSANAFMPNIRTPYTMSWTFGLQREINKNTVIEVRYVGNRNLQTWWQPNLNERNITTNGFLDEFKLAVKNLQANMAAGRGNNFKYYGTGTGTYALPITLAYFSGIASASAGDSTKYTSSNFSSTTWVNTLATTNPNPGSYASNLYSDATRRGNALAAGYAANLFVVNPAVQDGGAWVYGNGGFSSYNSMQVDLRRRMSKGMLFQANYTWSKALTGQTVGFLKGWDKALTATQLPHTFKVNWLYEMPFGQGKMLFGNTSGLVNRFIGGWEFQGTGRWQSGNLLDAGNVQLVGMTDEELRNAVGMWFDDVNKRSYYVPQDIITNTIAAYNTSSTTTTGYSTAYGVPTGRYFAPANQNSAGCIQIESGDCANMHHYVRGPRFLRFDMSLVKRVRFSETKNVELRGEFLNVFNNINFIGVLNPGSSLTWGQTSGSYRDLNQSQDPGGRLIQIVLRINF